MNKILDKNKKVLSEATSLTDVLKPSSTLSSRVINTAIDVLHKKWSEPHNLTFHEVAEIETFDKYTRFAGSIIIIVGENGILMLKIAVYQLIAYALIPSTTQQPEFGNISGYKLSDQQVKMHELVSQIGPVLHNYVARKDWSSMEDYNEKVRVRTKSSPKIGIYDFILKLKPLLEKYLGYLVADIEGHIKTKIKHNHFRGLSEIIDKMQLLTEFLDKLAHDDPEDWDHWDWINAAANNAIILAAHHLYPNDVNHSPENTASTITDHMKKGITDKIHEAVVRGDQKVIAVVWGYLKQELHRLPMTAKYREDDY